MNTKRNVAVAMLMIVSLMTVAPVEADHGGGMVTAVDVAAGGDHTCVLLDSGNVDCYGRNTYGQDADYLGGDAVAVAAGSSHTCALLDSGNVECYGYDFFGQAADYTGGDAVAVATGGYHTCVLLDSGDVDCYGSNGSGRAADYTGGDAVGVAAGLSHTCVLTSGGNVECYGSNSYGQAADYTGGDAIGVAAGGRHTCILLSGGDVDCYGYDIYGQATDWFGDSDGDGVHENDVDDDRIHNDEDNCPTIYNHGQENLDGDGLGDACDNDRDGDGVNNGADAFPDDSSEWQDSDGDGVGDNSDNCLTTYNPGQADFDGDGQGDACGTRFVALEKDVSLVPGGQVGQSVASIIVYDDGGDVCVDFVPADASAINVACTARALLGPADALVTRGETDILVLEPEPVTVDLVAGYHYNETQLFRATSLLGGEVEAWMPFAPGQESWYIASGDDVALFVEVTVYQDGEEVETIPLSIPYLGQALAAAEKSAGTL